MKVLVLDDDVYILKTVQDIMGIEGHDVECCSDAAIAVDKIKASMYDLVLFDYKMPGRDGIWFIENVNLPAGTKAMLMTAYGNLDLVRRIIAMGACGHIIKPFTATDLLRHVDFYCSQPVGDQSIAQQNEHVCSPVESVV